MSMKQSLVDNKDHILESLPTQEMKDEFLASLDSIEEVEAPSAQQLVEEAQAPDHVSEDMYDAIKEAIEKPREAIRMTKEEEAAAIEEALKQVPTGPDES